MNPLAAQNPLLLDIPQELSTPRLRLRVPRAGDGEIICPAVRESLPELKQWMLWATDDYNAQEAEEWCRRSAARFLLAEQLPFLISLDQGTHLGNLSVFNIDWKIRKCEIGYWIRTSHAGKGYISEASSAVIDLLRSRLRMRRIEIRTDVANQRSRAVAERLGFALEGIHRCDSLTLSGQIRDTCVYASIALD